MKRKIEETSLQMNESLESDSEEELDSDAELQEAFSKNLIRPGLNIEMNAAKKFANNQEALKRKYNDVYLKMDWIERMDITVPKSAESDGKNEEINLADNDFKREHSFFLQAQSAVLEGIKKLHELNVPTKRPIDYYAEMAKSDQHMKKVKEVLLSKEAELEKRDKVRKLRQLKKVGKQVQMENARKKQKEKKNFNESIESIKKGKTDASTVLDGNKRGVKGGTNKKKSDDMSNKKRKFKNTKYGHGGQKKRAKYNTAKSSADIGDYNPRLNGNKSKSKNKNKPKNGKKMRKQ